MFKNYPLLRSLALYRFMPFRFVLTATLFVIANIGLALQQYSIGHAIDTLKHSERATLFQHAITDPLNPWFWFILLTSIASIRAVIQYLAGLSALTIGQQLLSILRERIFSQVQHLDVSWHWKHGLGEVLSRTTRDSDKLKEALINFWRQVFESSLVVTVTVGLLCWYHPWLGLVPLLFIFLGLWVLFKLTNQLVVLDHQVASAYEKVSDTLAESVNGIRVVKAFQLEEKLLQRFNHAVDLFIHHSIQTIKTSAKRLPIPQVIIAGSYLWVIAFGAYLIGQNQLQVGQFVAAILMANLLVFRIESIGQVLHIFADARSSATRIWQMLDEKSAIEDQQYPLTLQWRDELSIKLENVSFQDKTTKNFILKQCSVEFRAGEIVTVVGKTGSGKTTLMNLLNRFIDPTEGQVLIGSEQMGWTNIKDLSLFELRHWVQIIPQENFFFSGTLADNLRVAKQDATEQEMKEALHLASASELLQRLDNGLDTLIGDKGVTLSGGQKQRLALARSILKNSPILALDDSTSALDATTEKQVLQRLSGLSDDGNHFKKTIIINSNKQTTIALSDRVIVLDQGHIIAQGTHAELVQNCLFYRELMGFQLEQQEIDA
ncbi:ABC transporter ATP-binding protein/permease [Acinetobacter baumannii]|jgi:ATP-binding cassette subfamily B protein|uniref:ABC transporter ATP-binding protein n=1 Tax=Acinetobacter pittii TaxID=48296 RepID=A0A6H0FUH6_ACIPI|nr:MULTISPECIES: ABC transporter ATP-binding protein [Acinetobacter]EHU1488839.1 ABC transporter ATP-binding protein [Acinetobacter baumannii]EKU5220654.1 ABC transporter ATP-binding protein [Acinetobacter baumannii]EKU6958798.1 ABC transporter ATP-binding protein [Acinetobacter baumannii]EKV0069390.1 ABC transporter ATP-binding protein [Acinetobacter baumannii]EKV1065451.1 ABC transporter ATP-binding protein [Acinetobacter baumannii]